MSSSLPLSRRAAEIEPFRVMDLLARARTLEAQGRSIVHMEIGEPDFPTPDPVILAGVKALAERRTHYTPALGLGELREAIARDYQRREGVLVDPEQIAVTPGASGALQLVLATLLDPGDEVLTADPGYPCNRHFVRVLDGRPRGIPVDAETAWQITEAHLAAHWSSATRAVLVASPGNPTGTLISAAELQALSRYTAERGAALIVDEIYRGLVYEQAPPSAAGLADHVFVLNSFSKYFGMTGWRLGWVVAPASHVRALDKLAQNLFLAAPTPAQHAALAAFSAETLAILETRRETFRQRRDFLVRALRELGFGVPVVPQGAFYVYADCSRYTDDSERFCRELLETAGVAVTPGVDFGEHRARTHVRFAYTTDMARLEEGVTRLAQFLGQSG